MLSSAEMVFGKQDNVSVICAYVDGEDDVSTRIKGFIDSIAPDVQLDHFYRFIWWKCE